MLHLNLGRIFVFGVITLSLWVLLISIYVLARQVILIKLVYQNQLFPSWKADELFLVAKEIKYDEGIDFEDTFKGLNKHTWERRCESSLENLCNYPIFPKLQTKEILLKMLTSTQKLTKLTAPFDYWAMFDLMQPENINS